jgi:hypothetical protein
MTVSSATAAHQSSSYQKTETPKTAPAASPSKPQDTVKLSAAAIAASSAADHDGDSH